MVVGATGAASDRFLVNDGRLYVFNGYCCNVLHYVAKCQKVSRPHQLMFLFPNEFKIQHLVLTTVTAFKFRQADRFYDGDIFIDAGESDAVLGIENKGAQSLRTTDNIYEFKDTKPPKSIQDSVSLRSPSSLGITQTTKTSSQTSLHSGAISLKESPISPTPRDITDKSNKSSERSILSHPRGGGSGGGKYDDGRNLLSSYAKSRETISDGSPTDTKPSTTPIPTARRSIKSSKTHLIEGVPQTEV